MAKVSEEMNKVIKDFVSSVPEIAAHTEKTDNPHGVNAKQLGLEKFLNVQSQASELNILKGAQITTAELNRLKGVRSSLQTQLDKKSDSSHTHNEILEFQNSLDNKVDKENDFELLSSVFMGYEKCAEGTVFESGKKYYFNMGTESSPNMIEMYEDTGTGGGSDFIAGETRAIDCGLSFYRGTDAMFFAAAHSVATVLEFFKDFGLHTVTYTGGQWIYKGEVLDLIESGIELYGDALEGESFWFYIIPSSDCYIESTPPSSVSRDCDFNGDPLRMKEVTVLFTGGFSSSSSFKAVFYDTEGNIVGETSQGTLGNSAFKTLSIEMRREHGFYSMVFSPFTTGNGRCPNNANLYINPGHACYYPAKNPVAKVVITAPFVRNSKIRIYGVKE